MAGKGEKEGKRRGESQISVISVISDWERVKI